MRRHRLRRAHKRPLAILAASAMVLIGLTGLLPATASSAADPAPIVSIIAGTGTAGFSGDGGPAAQAQVSRVAGLSTDALGNLYILDNGNNRIRKIDATDVITTVVGDGTPCTTPTDITVPLIGMCIDSGYGYGGIAASSDGSALVYRDNVGLSQATPNGNAYRYAGKYYGLWGPTDDGSKFAVSINPHDVALDGDNVIFIENRAVREVTADGQIVTLAGTSSDCNSGSDDTSPALGTCYWPYHLAVSGGKIYFTEQSEWNGPRVRVIDGDTVRTVAGNGERNDDPVLGGPATATGLPSDAAGLAVDKDGNIYFSGFQRGRIWKVAADTGILTQVTEFEGGVGWLTTDQSGNLYAALAYTNRIAKISGLTEPPAPAPTSVVTKVTIAAPSTTEMLLRRGISFESTGGPVNHYEYGWAKIATGATEPTSPIQRSDAGNVSRLYFGSTDPGSMALLFARAVGTDGRAGLWTAPQTVQTPEKPWLIVGIDSVTSGHHNDSSDSQITTCDDPNYGWAADFSKEWLATLPENWRDPSRVLNVAHSGFATQDRKGAKIDGSALDGGVNACKQKVSKVTPIALAESALKTSPNSWNRWIATGGINNTNWGDAVQSVVKANVILQSVGHGGLGSKDCSNKVMDIWDGNKPAVQASITSGVRKITTRLRIADPAVQITWLGYYNASGTGTNKVRNAPYMPLACESAVDGALSIIHGAIQAGLPSDAQFVPTDPVMRENDSLLQPLYGWQQLLDGAKNPAGWPHPNQLGGQAISGLLSP